MTRIVDQYDRKIAMRNAKDLALHQLNRVWDAEKECEEAISKEDHEAALVAVNRLSNLAGKAQQAIHVWKGQVLDWLHNEAPKLPEVAQEELPVPAAAPPSDIPF